MLISSLRMHYSIFFLFITQWLNTKKSLFNFVKFWIFLFHDEVFQLFLQGGRNWGGQESTGPPSFLDLYSKNFKLSHIWGEIFFFYLVVPPHKKFASVHPVFLVYIIGHIWHDFWFKISRKAELNVCERHLCIFLSAVSGN